MNDIELNQYIEKLPQQVKVVLEDGTWELRTLEIAKKYSLSDMQADSLANIVSLLIIGLQKPESLLEVISSDVGISKLLAEQIVADLESRIFEYALKIIEAKDKPKSPQQNITKLPEVKPDNLPAVEIGEAAHNTTSQEKTFFAAKPPSEAVQKPYGVPRFGMSQIEPKVAVINLTQNKPASPQTAMDNKMSSITVNIGENFAGKQAEEPPKMPTTKYDGDPYREPIN